MNVADYAKPTNRYFPFTVCGVPDCGKPHKALNLCVNHYMKHLAQRKKDGFTRSVMPVEQLIAHANLPKTDKCFCGLRVHGKNLCVNHYARYNRWKKANR